MKQYLNLLEKILNTGIEKQDRTGVGTISIFSANMEFDMSDGFPLLTTKKMFTKGIIHELLWMLKGVGDVESLQKVGVHIWDSWPQHDDKYIPYPTMWRRYPGRNGEVVDQIQNVIDLIKNDPNSRRIIVDCWNAAETPYMTLTPCHSMFQFYVRGEYLDMKLYVRSNDCFLGMPFNIAQYSLLLMMISQVTNKRAGKLYYTTGDTHIYLNHIEQVKLQLTREPKSLPQMIINPDVKRIDDFKFEDFTLVEYESWPGIKAPVAV